MRNARAIAVAVPRGRYAREARLVRRTLGVALASLGREVALEVFLILPARMRELNRRFRGKDVPTNVLSFPAPREFPRPDLPRASYRGEVYLCPAVVRARGEDLRYLAIHGLLHLLGYTHVGKRDTMRMEAKERQLLAKILGHKL